MNPYENIRILSHPAVLRQCEIIHFYSSYAAFTDLAFCNSETIQKQ